MKASQTFAGVAFLSFMCFTASGADTPPLTLQEAHGEALRNHPQIRVADLRALAARQVTRQFQSAFFPTLAVNVMSVGTANENTRLGAIGGLNNPSIFDRNAEGLVLSQLITDFGRTANLTGSAKLRAQAEADNAQATREQILLAVDASFYAAQQAQSVTRVAEQTVATRQLFLEQVSAKASSKLVSELDVSFAKVNVDDAKLLLSKAQNDLQAEFARLANLMGLREPKTYRLVEEPSPPPLSTNVPELVEQALQARPELLSLRNSREASLKFARAEKALHYPTVSAVGSAGVIPIGDPQLPQNYAAAGVSVTLPLYVGGLYSARIQEAELRARAAEESLRDLENNVIRDVRIAWLNAQNAFDRLRITAELLDNAKLSYDLAQSRYDARLTSIVEVNQAQLNLLAAQITYADTQYEYLLQRSALSFQTGTLR
jgi:outer membrane protein